VLDFCIDNTSAYEDPLSLFRTLPALTLLDSSVPFFDYLPRKLVGKTDICNEALQDMFTEVGDFINQYDIYYPCISGAGLDCMNYTAQTDYLNSAAVQSAIHAKKPSIPWSVCADVNFTQSWPSVLFIYPELMGSIHVTVYAGDVTFNVPALGTEIWVEAIGTNGGNYQAWMVEGQVAGYFKKYDGITYVTVKDSGHMVPTYTPDLGLALFENYLDGKF